MGRRPRFHAVKLSRRGARDTSPSWCQWPTLVSEDEADELGGRVNTDLPFEDVVGIMLNTDLRESEDKTEEA